MFPSISQEHCVPYGRMYELLGFVALSHTLPKSTKSPETFGLAKRWARECSTEHKHCSLGPGNPFRYPTKLLECGPFQDNDTGFRLVETRHAALTGPYMTLSHCWRTADCLKFTSENQNRLMKGINMRSLPRLYQDAVEVTRTFGVRYLWIDSLCIIQHGDNMQDRKREAKCMGEVYRHSYCNISAADAMDSKDSLFTTRFSPWIAPPPIRLRDGTLYRCLDRWLWRRKLTEL